MTDYTVIEYKDKAKKDVYLREGLDDARFRAYLDVNYMICDYAEITDNGKSIGVVLFDRSHLGMVWVPYQGNQAYHLTKYGRVSKFKDEREIRFAKKIREGLWRGFPIPTAKKKSASTRKAATKRY